MNSSKPGVTQTQPAPPSSARPSASDLILTQSPWTLLLKFALPGILGMLTVGLNTFIDAVYIGRLLGDTALAGASLAFPLTLIVTASAAMIGIGSASVLSRAIGRKDTHVQGRVFTNLVVLSFLASLVVASLGFIFAESLVRLMGGTGEVLAVGTRYIRVFMLGAFFMILGVSSNMLIRGEGRIAQAMVFAGISMGSNIALNPVFIAGLGLGIEGAALATIIAMALYAALNVAYFLRGASSVAVKLLPLRLEPSIVRPVLSVGVSGGAMQVMSLLQQFVIFRTIASLGTEADIALMGAGYRIVLLSVIPVFGLMQALQPVVGINYGAGQLERVRRSLQVFMLTGVGLLIVAWLPMQFFPDATLSLILPDVSLSANDLLNFRVLILALPTLPLIFSGITLFQAIGNGRLAGLLLIMRQVVLFVPTVIVASRLFGVDGVYYSFAGVDLTCAVVIVVITMLELRRLERRPLPVAQPTA